MEQTRQKIVDGALSLHLEKGIAETSIKDIAARAEVGIGTVYFHFATYEDVVRACAVKVSVSTRPPTPEIFEGIDSLEGRVERLVQELFGYYERYHWFDRLRCEREKLAIVAEGVARRERAIQAMVQEAVHPLAPEEAVVQTMVALTDFSVWKTLSVNAMSTPEAARRVSEVLLAWIQSEPTFGSQMPTE